MPTLPLPELLRWWCGLPPSAGRTRVLALDGRSGSGKTSLSAALAETATKTAAEIAVNVLPDQMSAITILHLDDAYPGWDGLDAVTPRIVTQVLRPLAAGRPAGYRRWDWAADRDGEWRPVPASSLLLLEGIGSGALACAPLLAGLIWLEAPERVRRTRALDRDGAAYAPHWQRWADQEERYLRREDPARRADLVLDAGLPDGNDAQVITGPGPISVGGPAILADRRGSNESDRPRQVGSPSCSTHR